MSGSDIGSRKSEHLNLCIEDDVAFQDKTNLFEDVQLVHDALPELALDQIDLRTELVGKTLRAPLVIAAMTGGVERANAINRDLASVAEELGIGFALGSQRPLLSHGIEDGYRVRDVAPTALVLGNIGLVQAKDTPTAALVRLVEIAGADALCLHLNPAMEVVQPGGDSDFRGGLEAIARIARELPVPVIVKETGCGLSRSVGERIRDCGVLWVDTSGAGGTSWVGVETKRAKATKALGERFWDWGIPTAASVLQLRGLGLGIVATGGMTDGLMIARALALGARAGGIARPFLQAHAAGGIDAVRTLAKGIVDEIRLACLLTGSRTLADLQKAPVVIGPRLQRWMPAGVELSVPR